MCPHQGCVEGQEHLCRPGGNALPNAPQNAIGLLGHKDTLLAHRQLVVHQDPQSQGFDGWNTWWIKNCQCGCIERVVVNSSLSVWRPVMSGVPQGLVLALILLNTLVRDMNSGIKGTLGRFSDNTELCGAVDMLRGRDATRGTWCEPHEVQQSKVQGLTPGLGQCQTHLQIGWVEKSPAEKDLGVTADGKLNVSWQCPLSAHKAKCPALHQMECGLQVEGGVWSCETQPGVLDLVLVLPT
ncbi:rna-directed dna polymerase from mobile element jockey-like [Willisornis vidua]|uniref:Rna-directed dna polymerase from mobile element jockey-like n=1 Tax=Willisornis vidua TaxID=1566151 RepID=A0ABQ9DV70_9PASS|nr:rna-directed dna polymerase from mobile element jockey-like [Willisornis vidua]